MNQERPPLDILLVEDDDDHAELILRGMEEHDVTNRIFRVRDGEQALDYLCRRGDYADPTDSPRPHVILLDLRLPKVDGLDVLRRIKDREHLKRIPVVVLTTSEAESDVARAYDLHANAYLVKPVSFDKFQDLTRDLGFFWLEWNKAPEPDGRACGDEEGDEHGGEPGESVEES